MSGNCFWTDLVRCREDCTLPVLAPALNLLALGDPANPTRTVAYPTSSDLDANGDHYVGSVDVVASIGPGQPAIVVSLPADAILRTPAANACSFCGLGPHSGIARLRITKPSPVPSWVSSEVINVSGSVYSIPFDITHVTLRDAGGAVLKDANTGLTYPSGGGSVDETADPWIYLLQPVDFDSAFSTGTGWVDMTGGSIELTLSYDGSTPSGTPLQLQGVDLISGIQCYC